jgi:hypothetical protein
MPYEHLEEIGVPVSHRFSRAAVQGWWFVPTIHDATYFKILRHLWRYSTSPRQLALITAYFQGVMTQKTFAHFEPHLLEIFASVR